MIEIGVMGGGSLAMWKDYFGKGCTIIGVDINPDCKRHEADGIHVYIGSQDDPALLEEIFTNHPKVDIILDDGSHVMQHMIKTFNLTYNRLTENGVYIVEDTHTCYWNEFGGGLGESGSFMEFAKTKIDELNAVHARGLLPVSNFTKSTDYISFYDSVVVFEKRKQGKRQAPVTEPM
jgi:hypothetical protein